MQFSPLETAAQIRWSSNKCELPPKIWTSALKRFRWQTC